MKRKRGANDRGAGEDLRLHGSKSFYSLHDALESGSSEVFRAMRLARGFERQKLGRRQKDAQENNSTDDVARINKEIAVLKGFDLAAMAEFYLYKTLLRIPSISSAPQFPASIAKQVAKSSKPVDSMYLNVSARLFKSNAVSSALENCLKSIYEVIGLEPQLGRKKRLRKGDFQHTSSSMSEQPRQAGKNKSSDHETLSASPSESEAMTTRVSQIQVEPSMADIDRDGDSLTSNDSSNSYRSEAGSNVGAESEVSDEMIDNDYTKEVNVARKPLTTTAFLPSLAGGYISGSESEASDVDDLDEKKTTKNRPGQRARQAHWERKYGANAAHLQKQRQSRDHGWDAKRGAQDRSARGKHHSRARTTVPPKQAGKHRDRKSESIPNPQTLGRQVTRGQQNSRAKPESLHPSWEAAKRQKEQTTAAAFQGKKVVFD